MKIIDKIMDMARNPKYVSMYDEKKLAKQAQRIAEAELKEEGRIEGVEEKALDIARNMLKEKMDPSIISKVTGLSKSVIKTITL